MLFSFFDPINYESKTVKPDSGSLTNADVLSVPMTDIFRNYKEYFNKVAKNYTLKTYYISGAPRPEELANQLYGNVQLYWVLLMCNNIYDPYYGWITGQESAYQAAIQRYATAGGNQVLYHVNEKGEKFWNLVNTPENPYTWYDKGDTEKRYPQYEGPLAAVDIYEDAIRKNEYKREIKIIDPNDIESFVSALIREMEKAL
ncbi:baseplate wedge subunit [Escherichia phage vB_EcoM_005]|uniref:Baseplate wedge subunit n=1 Tax=Escherichia phage vB_EcoM_005 TaxID=2500761 RepID=A0A3Q9R9I5_9CAUD|nr:baseplate wedge subunit [Escherichia phage vB_EcoM_005]AZV00968.1 baseplate wedge subunit [Escherichia phage vB_EcoM_005]